TNHQALWCHVQPSAETKWNIELLTATGQVIAQIRGFQLRTVPSAAIQSDRLRTDWLYTLAWKAAPLSKPPAPHQAPACWLLFGVANSVSTQLATTLAAAGTPTILVTPGVAFSLTPPAAVGDVQRATVDPTDPAMFRQLLKAITPHAPSLGIGYFWGMGEGLVQAEVPAQAHHLCSGLLHLVQALNEITTPARLWIGTQACQTPALEAHGQQRFPTQKTKATALVAAGALWGLGRTVALEQPQLHSTCLDLDPDTADETQVELLRQELGTGERGEPGASQIAYRNTTRYVAELDRWQAPPRIDKTAPMRLQLRDYGSLEYLNFVPLVRRTPGPQEIEVEVKAAGLNLRDVLNALGLLAEYYRTALGITQASAIGLGFECAGLVTAVGDAVRGFAVGDRVMGLGTATGTFASYITVPAAQMVAIPTHLNDAAAATIPLTFLTAWYGLVELAKLQPGERVLIHAAAGGVGQAAVQIAQARGAAIFATASPSKWEFLRDQGIAHIFNSRTLDFADEILQITGGRGVDVVFNSLNGDFIDRSFAVLGQQGRFVEIGKLGIWRQEQVIERRPDVAYHPYDLGEVLSQTPTLYATLWQAIGEQLKAGTLQPLPYTTFPAHASAAAFRTMQQARHVGKVVIVFEQPRAVVLQQDATYLITGGLGALGLQIAQQLIEDGVKQLVLTGRHGIATDEQRQLLAQLAQAGAKIHVWPADMANPEAVKALLDRCQTLAPLRGIVHAAGVLDDGILTEQTPDRFATVMQPKVNGAWHLHALTQGLDLDFFVCFSSAAALLGSPGQSNYAAANAFMDTLMQQRQQAGLPGLSINWGPWADIGMAAQLPTRGALQAQGLTLIAPQQGKRLFGYLLGQSITQIAVLPLKASQPIEQKDRPEEPFDWQTYQTMALDERRAAVTKRLRSMVAATGGFSIAQLDIDQSLLSLGLDSLMAVQLRNYLLQIFALTIPISLLLDGGSIASVTDYLLEHLAEPSPSQLAASAQPLPAPPPNEMRNTNGHLPQPEQLPKQEQTIYQKIEGEL
ncbi:MAG: SDR family NAD(P)-dependent oxidoreductase, partial [Chloroflexi bacterium]|nr:SDR family NAD(P)-dependent oxidoreductase [Chloroflexota bacterium]